MSKAKIVRIICNIFLILFLIGFVLSFVYLIHGSLEIAPAQEQQNKARLGAFVLMLMFGAPLYVCITVKMRYKK